VDGKAEKEPVPRYPQATENAAGRRWRNKAAYSGMSGKAAGSAAGYGPQATENAAGRPLGADSGGEDLV
jgi:hypothetical protein